MATTGETRFRLRNGLDAVDRLAFAENDLDIIEGRLDKVVASIDKKLNVILTTFVSLLAGLVATLAVVLIKL